MAEGQVIVYQAQGVKNEIEYEPDFRAPLILAVSNNGVITQAYRPEPLASDLLFLLKAGRQAPSAAAPSAASSSRDSGKTSNVTIGAAAMPTVSGAFEKHG